MWWRRAIGALAGAARHGMPWANQRAGSWRWFQDSAMWSGSASLTGGQKRFVFDFWLCRLSFDLCPTLSTGRPSVAVLHPTHFLKRVWRWRMPGFDRFDGLSSQAATQPDTTAEANQSPAPPCLAKDGAVGPLGALRRPANFLSGSQAARSGSQSEKSNGKVQCCKDI